MEVNKMKSEYLDFDNCSSNGAFTVPSDDNLDMLSLLNYCRKNNIQYSDLSDEEISLFRIRNKKAN